ncbi:stage III sporulation protein AF [Evansella sp. AB-P1]|uniref:stage III sporulation protein AF n=1 Tax=Evansella sp. AB-P1 TaxID=3037653 RepID=UPI00241D6A20|nr:stage III sporulation protein AF [Evansella sp. AB-P1]MDG5788697.1 stage III sporulation protein AF [Evansella sp. AB-P1]
MSMITAWITNIILLILFASILELLLPNSKMQRYVKLVVGLMLLMVMLQPLLSVFQMDPDEWLNDLSSWTNEASIGETRSMETVQIDVEKEYLASISEQMAPQLKNQVADEFEDRFGVVIVDVSLEFTYFQEDEDLLDSLGQVYVIAGNKEEVIDGDGSNEVRIIKIDDIYIKREQLEQSDHENDNEFNEMVNFLSEEWAIPKEKIVYQMISNDD